jgi:hypothetical protein
MRQFPKRTSRDRRVRAPIRVLRTMQERGYIHQCSDLPGLDDKARSGTLVGYIGFDCTAPSLHVGSLVQIMMLHWLHETGGKARCTDGRRHHHGAVRSSERHVFLLLFLPYSRSTLCNGLHSCQIFSFEGLLDASVSHSCHAYYLTLAQSQMYL